MIFLKGMVAAVTNKPQVCKSPNTVKIYFSHVTLYGGFLVGK